MQNEIGKIYEITTAVVPVRLILMIEIIILTVVVTAVAVAVAVAVVRAADITEEKNITHIDNRHSYYAIKLNQLYKWKLSDLKNIKHE